jgi:hypothetical protein
MAQELSLFRNGLMQRSTVFDVIKGEGSKLSAGVGPGFARITYKGGKWGLKYQGETRMFRRYITHGNAQVDDGPNPKLDIVILDVAERPSKYFYLGAYGEGDINPPDCWSTNGIKPDAGVPRRQSETCAGCPHNAFGSAKPRADNQPSRGKACTDHKRLAVVPASDIENKAYGGPMLLLVPPTSLKKLAPYEQKLAHGGFRFMEVWTQLSFDEAAAFPLFEFDAIRPLTDQEGQLVLKMRADDMTKRILTVEVEGVEGYDQPEYAAPSPASVNQPADPTPPPVSAPAPTPQPLPTKQDDGLALPPHLVRTAQPAPAPAPAPAPPPPAAAAATAPAPAVAQADTAGLAQMAALLKQLTPEQLAALGIGAPAARQPRKPRTPPVSPRPVDTTAMQTAPPANENDAGGDLNVADIMGKIDSLIPSAE